LLLLASHLLQPAHDPDTTSEVAAQTAHRSAFDASTVVGLLAVICLVPALLALGSLLADRWSGHVGVALAVSGALGLCFLLGTGVGATVIAAHGGASAVALTEELEGSTPFGVGVGIMLLGWTFGLITLAVGLGRSRRLPWWAAACIAVAPIVPAVAGGKWPVAGGFVLLLVGFAAAVPSLRAPQHRAPDAAAQRAFAG
jgi:hypothetical protein